MLGVAVMVALVPYPYVPPPLTVPPVPEPRVRILSLDEGWTVSERT